MWKKISSILLTVLLCLACAAASAPARGGGLYCFPSARGKYIYLS